MKRVIAILTLIGFLVPVPAALAGGGGNHRFALDQQWKRVEAFEKKQSEKFKKLEREAERATKSLKGQSGGSIPIDVNYRPCGR